MHVYMFVYALTYVDKLSEYPTNIVCISRNILELKKTGRKNLKECLCEYTFLYVCRNMKNNEAYMKKKRKNSTVAQIYMRDYSYTSFPLFFSCYI